MSDKKVELKNENLDEILGGLELNTVEGYLVGTNDRSIRYYYDDFDAVKAFYKANVDKSLVLSERDAKLISGMLEAGLIHQ